MGKRPSEFCRFATWAVLVALGLPVLFGLAVFATPASATPGAAASPSPTPVPDTSCASPMPSASPTPYALRWHFEHDGAGATAAPTVSPSPSASPAAATDAPFVELPKPGVAMAKSTAVTVVCARVFARTTGLEVDFKATRSDTGFHATRKTSGIRFAENGQYGAEPPDQRFVLSVKGVTGTGSDTQPFAVYVNPAGSCFVEKDGALDDDRAACESSVAPSSSDAAKGYDGCETRPDATPMPKASPSPDPTSDTNPAPFCGRLVVKWPAVFDRLRPHGLPAAASVTTRILHVCTAFTDHVPKLESNELSCADVQLAESDGSGDAEQTHIDRAFSDGSSNTASPTPSAASASFARRRPAAAAAPPGNGASGSASNSSGSGSGSGLTFTGDLSKPFSVQTRLSVAVANLDAGQILDRLHQNLSATAKQLVQRFGSSLNTLGCKGDNCPDYSFKGVDSDVFSGVAAKKFRLGTSSTFVDEEVDLKPIDFTHVQNVNYGGKFVIKPLEAGALDQNLGLAWYRDIANVATGTAVRYDRDLDKFVTAGVTYVVANNDTKANVYRTDTHTTNAVFDVVGHLLDNHSLNLLGRFGNATGWKGPGGNDKLGVLTYAPVQPGIVVDFSGTAWRPTAALGYRVIDAGYDPLGTVYDPFTGTQSAFGTVGIQRKAGDPDNWQHNRDVALTLTGVRAWDATRPRYNAVSAVFSIAYAKGRNLTLTHTRSNIASSVYARQDGSVLVSDKDDGATLLRNDADEVKADALKSSAVNVSLGLSWSNAPSDCSKTPAPHCNVKYHRKGTASVQVNTDLLLDASVAFAPQQQQLFGQKAVPSNTLDPKITLAYQGFCSDNIRVQPAVTYDRNTADNGNAFVRGDLLEARVDFAAAKWRLGVIGPNSVLRFSYKLESGQSNNLVPAVSHPFYVNFAWDQAAQNFQKYCQNKLHPAKS